MQTVLKPALKKPMKKLIRVTFVLIFILITITMKAQNQGQKTLRIAIAGTTHDHIGFILNREKKSDLQVVGIYEPDQKLAEQYARKFHFDTTLIYNNLDRMLEKVKPEGVVAFGSIYDHLAVVEACAPRGIHVMVEKPLAVSMEHAVKMQKLAEKYKIQLLTDFETSWYPSTAKSWQLVNDSNYVGKVRRVVIHDGHQGPKEIGCSKVFLNWLTDPVQNGGGAIMDFGCYGANLMTYLTRGEMPVSVTAVTRQLKPEIYPKVDDDATVIVSYPNSVCVIQASWNWPFGRKDMEIYGERGYIISENNKDMRMRNAENPDEIRKQVSSKDIAVIEDPFSYFIGVIRGKIIMSDYDPYSLKNNLTVVRILDAARESAKTGKTVEF
jgi:predicted dehydrogenase